MSDQAAVKESQKKRVFLGKKKKRKRMNHSCYRNKNLQTRCIVPDFKPMLGNDDSQLDVLIQSCWCHPCSIGVCVSDTAENGKSCI